MRKGKASALRSNCRKSKLSLYVLDIIEHIDETLDRRSAPYRAAKEAKKTGKAVEVIDNELLEYDRPALKLQDPQLLKLKLDTLQFMLDNNLFSDTESFQEYEEDLSFIQDKVVEIAARVKKNDL